MASPAPGPPNRPHCSVAAPIAILIMIAMFVRHPGRIRQAWRLTADLGQPG